MLQFSCMVAEFWLKQTKWVFFGLGFFSFFFFFFLLAIFKVFIEFATILLLLFCVLVFYHKTCRIPTP